MNKFENYLTTAQGENRAYVDIKNYARAIKSYSLTTILR